MEVNNLYYIEESRRNNLIWITERKRGKLSKGTISHALYCCDILIGYIKTRKDNVEIDQLISNVDIMNRLVTNFALQCFVDDDLYPIKEENIDIKITQKDYLSVYINIDTGQSLWRLVNFDNFMEKAVKLETSSFIKPYKDGIQIHLSTMII